MRVLVAVATMVLSATAAAQPAMVTLDVAGDVGVLQHVSNGYDWTLGRWDGLCVTPCRIDAPLGGYYRVRNAASKTRALKLEAHAGDTVYLQEMLGHRADAALAVGITGGSLTFVALGMEFAALFGALQSLCFVFCHGPPTPSWAGPVAVSGAVIGLTGVIALVAGFEVFHANHKSRLTQVPADGPIVMPASLDVHGIME